MNTQDQRCTRVSRHCPLSLLAGAVIGMAVPVWGQGPTLNIERAAAVIDWPVSAEEYIVLSSATMDGPWIPCLDPIARGPGVLQTAVRTTDQSVYFQLAKGTWFMDDFDDRDIEGWTTFLLREFEGPVPLDANDEQLRIHGICPECPDHWIWVGSVRGDSPTADFAVSIDIQAWEESMGLVGLNTRIDPRIFADPPLYRMYMAGVDFESSSAPGMSSLWLHEVTGWLESHSIADPVPFEKMDSARDYRLVFAGVGSALTLRLFDLANPGIALATMTAQGTILTKGHVGLFTSGAPEVDITLDNFVAVGTRP